MARLWLSLIILLESTTIVAGGADITRLTQFYTPEKWALFPIEVYPFSPFYSTELSVPDTARLNIDVFLIDDKSKSRPFVRHIVQPADQCYLPAVYRIDWWCVCDSMDMPVSSGRYSIVVTAFDQAPWDKVIFTDSIEILVFGEWESLKFDPTDFKMKMLIDWYVRTDGSLQETDVCSEYSRMEVVATRLLRGADSTDTDKLVIKLIDALDSPGRDSFRSDARGFICARDSISSCGYRVLRKIAPFGGMHSVWELSFVEGELLLLDCVSHWPVVVDASRFLEKLKVSGELK